MTARRPALPLLVALLLPCAAGARTEDRAHPECRERLAAVRRIGVVAPKVEAFELAANNARVLRPDWTDAARANVAAGIVAALRERGYEARPFEPAAPPAKEELQGVALLYDAVWAAVIQATYAYAFPPKLDRFEYSVGDVQALLAAEGLDALAFVHGVANISSGGRVALQLLGGAGSGIDRLFVAVVDRAGTVLWFVATASTTSDLRDAGSAAGFAREAVRLLPGAAR